MAKTNSESVNMDKMRQHQMMKKAVVNDGSRHEDQDIMVCTDLIDTARSAVLNGCSEHASLLEVLSANPDDKALVSDADAQLIVKVIFKERTNISSVQLRFDKPPSEEGGDAVYAKPRTIRVFTNKEDLDFGDAEEFEPAAQTVISDAGATEASVTCVGHKFQRLESLQIFVMEAADPEADKSFLNRIRIMGHQAADYHAHYK